MAWSKPDSHLTPHSEFTNDTNGDSWKLAGLSLGPFTWHYQKQHCGSPCSNRNVKVFFLVWGVFFNEKRQHAVFTMCDLSKTSLWGLGHPSSYVTILFLLHLLSALILVTYHLSSSPRGMIRLDMGGSTDNPLIWFLCNLSCPPFFPMGSEHISFTVCNGIVCWHVFHFSYEWQINHYLSYSV